MICSKEFSVVVGPGVPWQNLVWNAFGPGIVSTGTGIGTWVAPGPGGTGNYFEGRTQASIAVGSDLGRVSIRGELAYAGPNRNCRVRMTIVNNEIVAQPGVNSLSCTHSRNGFIIATATMAPSEFNGILDLDFTAQTGLLWITFDMFSSNPDVANSNPMTLHCVGQVMNL